MTDEFTLGHDYSHTVTNKQLQKSKEFANFLHDFVIMRESRWENHSKRLMLEYLGLNIAVKSAER